MLLDWEAAQRKGLRASEFSKLFSLKNNAEEEITPKAITSFPYFSPIEYGRRWILNMPGRLDNGLITDARTKQERKPGQLQEETVRKLVLDQRELSHELRTLKGEMSELKRQINDLSHLIKANRG